MTARLILVGGFLGAGKTTWLLQAAQALTRRGHRVAIVTNDQGQGLVDTALASDRSIPVQEVAGGCFCCRFPDLLEAIRQLQATIQPDVILAEPVGSCTDLVATILLPLHTQFPNQYDLAPLTILIDPQRDIQSFPETVAYLYQQQLAEADIIGMSKSDLLAPGQAQAQAAQLAAQHPGAQVIGLSARTGAGMDEWLGRVLTTVSPVQRTLDLNYERYAAAEATLGWLNAKGTLVAPQPFSASAWVERVLGDLEQLLIRNGAAVAHVKLHVTAPGVAAKASLIQTGRPLFWDLRPADAAADRAEFVLNARVNSAPDLLDQLVRQALHQRLGDTPVASTITQLESFSPAAPKPTFRLVAAPAA